FDQLLEDARDHRRLDLGLADDENGAIRPHRQPGAQLLLRDLAADADQYDLGPALLFLDAERFLDRDFAERIDDVLDVVRDDSGTVGPHLDGRVRIRNPLRRYQDLHGVPPR